MNTVPGTKFSQIFKEKGNASKMAASNPNRRLFFFLQFLSIFRHCFHGHFLRLLMIDSHQIACCGVKLASEVEFSKTFWGPLENFPNQPKMVTSNQNVFGGSTSINMPKVHVAKWNWLRWAEFYTLRFEQFFVSLQFIKFTMLKTQPDHNLASSPKYPGNIPNDPSPFWSETRINTYY